MITMQDTKDIEPFTNRRVPKFPSMKHLPFSKEEARSNKYMTTQFLEESLLTSLPIIKTEKVDGSNACITTQHVYARSHGHEARHPSFSMLKQIHSNIGYRIPEHLAIFGEWLYAIHSIKYTSLPSYFLVFAVLNMKEMQWISWESTVQLADRLGLATVPVLQTYETWDGRSLGPPEGDSQYGDTREGYVIRVKPSFPFSQSVQGFGKCVRRGHVSTSDHWKQQPVQRNQKIHN